MRPIVLIEKKDARETKIREKLRRTNAHIIICDSTNFKNDNQVEHIKTEANLSKNDFLLNFSVRAKFSKSLIYAVNEQALNIHAGLPSQRGIGGVNWSIYKQDTEIGVTLHLIDDCFDSGKIIFVKSIKLKKSDNLTKGLKKLNFLREKLLIEIIARAQSSESFSCLVKSYHPFPTIPWTGELLKKSDLNKMAEININDTFIDTKELSRRIDSFSSCTHPCRLITPKGTYIIKPET